MQTATEPYRKLAAILSADAVGYSRLMEADESATVQILHAYRSLMQQGIERHHGEVVNAPGDALLAKFPSAVGAVCAAVEIQRDLEERNRELAPERRMHFRVGVNLSDVIEQNDGTIYGDGVNIAARLEAFAEAGGVCVSGSVFDAVDGKLEVGFDFVGHQQVKNISRPVRVYRVRAGKPAQASSGRSASRRKRWWPGIVILALCGATGASEWEPGGAHPTAGPEGFNPRDAPQLPFIPVLGCAPLPGAPGLPLGAGPGGSA